MSREVAEGAIAEIDTSDGAYRVDLKQSPESDKKSISVLVVGELGSGSEEFNEDAVIGLAEDLKQRRARGEAPDVLVLNSLLPYIPKFSNAANDNKLTTLREGIDSLSDAAAAIKPHIERILNNLPEHAVVFYTYGEDDRRNIEAVKRNLRYEYAYPSSKLQDNYYYYLKEIIDREEIANTARETVRKLNKDYKAAAPHGDKRARLRGNIEEAKRDLQRAQSEVKELGNILTLFNELQNLRTRGFDKNTLSQLSNDTRTELKGVRDEIAKLQATDADDPQLELLQAKARMLASRLRAVSKRLNEANDAQDTADYKARMKNIIAHSGNIPVDPTAAKKIEELADAIYRRSLGDALGRKHRVAVMPLNENQVTASKQDVTLNMLLAHKLSNTSPNFTKNSTNATMQMVGRLLQDLKIAPNVVITTHNTNTAFAIKPLEHNSKSVVYVLNQGPLWDVNAIEEEMAAGKKTERTQALARGMLDSSVSILRFDKDGSVTRESLTAKYLLRKRAESDAGEAKELSAVEKEKAKIGSSKDPSAATKDTLDKAIAKSKRPSELSEHDIASLSIPEIQDLVKFKAGAKELGDTSKFRLGVFSDVHYGSDTDMELLDAAVKDAKAKGIDVLVMAGDMIEGSYNDYKYELRENKRAEIAGEYRDFLKAKGLSQDQVAREMVKFYDWYTNNLSKNIEEQAYGLIKKMLPLIEDIVTRGGSIVIVSGNHFNKTYKDNQNDEAERLASVIKPFFMALEEHNPGLLPKDWESHIKVIHGGETGAGQVTIGQDTTMFVSHRPPNFEKQSNHADLMVAGHEHEYEEKQNTYGALLKMFHMQKSESAYVQTFGVPIGKGLNGYGYFDVETDDKGRVIRLESHPVLRQTLINIGLMQDNKLMDEFFEKRDNIELQKGKGKEKSKGES